MKGMVKLLMRLQRSAVMAVLCMVALVVAAAPTMACNSPYPPNARIMGMGWTHVGVADNPDAACSNPAVFGFNEGEISLSLGAGFGGSLKDCNLLYAGICDKDRGLGAGGLAFVYQKTADEEATGGLRYTTYRLGKSVTDWLSLGAGVGYVKIGDDSRSFLTTDVGAMLNFGYLCAGIQASGVTRTTFGEDEPMKTEFSPEFAIGLSVKPSKSFTMAVDLHGLGGRDSGVEPWYSGGAEVWIADSVALRGGAIRERDDGEWATSYTGGVGFKVNQGEIGYSLMWKQGGMSAQYATASARF
ncbi:MAG: hypothetical protein PHP20_10065 [Firmicutes bacterium]|nr:hypothetical protein [Bacillota bacterium]MDD4793395.1 hypothetical protein [Bacillota bacterium]